MSLIPIGFFAVAGAGVADFELIETQVVGAGTQATSITFTGLNIYANDYKYLQVRSYINGTHGTELVLCRINGDTTASYANYIFFQNSGSVSRRSFSGRTYIEVGAAGGLIANFADPFSTTKNKSVEIFSSSFNSSVGYGSVYSGSGMYYKTDAISSITFTFATSDVRFNAGTRFSIYGVR